MQFTYKKATIQDIDILVETRIEVLRAANKLDATVDMVEVEKQSYEYYKIYQYRIINSSIPHVFDRKYAYSIFGLLWR